MHREEMFVLVRTWLVSPQNLSAFARRQGIAYQKLSYGRRPYQQHQAQALEADQTPADAAPAFTDRVLRKIAVQSPRCFHKVARRSPEPRVSLLARVHLCRSERREARGKL